MRNGNDGKRRRELWWILNFDHLALSPLDDRFYVAKYLARLGETVNARFR